MSGRAAKSAAIEAPGWHGERPFIGRDEVIARLEVVLASALDGEGHVIVLHGPPGSGRAALVRRFAEEARRRHRRLRIGIADAADPERPAWAQLAFGFTARQRAGAALLRTLKEWLFLIPIIGNVVTAIVESIQELRPKKKDEKAALGTGSTVDQVRMLLSVGGSDPRLIILENLEASDPSELAGAFALVQRIRETRSLFVATATSTGGRLPRSVADLLHEAERLKCGRAVEISSLTAEQCADAMASAVGSPLPEAWRGWLDTHAPTTPLELWRLMDEAVAAGQLRREGGRWAWTPAPEASFRPPPSAHGPIDADTVSAADRALLAAAGRLGARFEVHALALALGIDETIVADRLAAIARRGVIALDATIERDGDLIDVYRFVRPADAQRWADTAHADGTNVL